MAFLLISQKSLFGLHDAHECRHVRLLAMIFDDSSLEYIQLIKFATDIVHQIVIQARQLLITLIAFCHSVLQPLHSLTEQIILVCWLANLRQAHLDLVETLHIFLLFLKQDEQLLGCLYCRIDEWSKSLGKSH